MKKIIKVVFAILLAILLLMITGCVAMNDEEKYNIPKITYGEFPFAVEYEMDGEKFVIEDTVICEFNGYLDIPNSPNQYIDWNLTIKNRPDDYNIKLVHLGYFNDALLAEGEKSMDTAVYLNVGSPNYYMGNPSFSPIETDAPCIIYTELVPGDNIFETIKQKVLKFEEAEEMFGIKITKFEFSKPIENTFDNIK